jgi:hypothetical protein
VKTDGRNHSRVLQDLRAVTLQEPQQDETRVDTVLGRDVRRKAVQWKWDFWENRALIHTTDFHKTYFELAFQT